MNCLLNKLYLIFERAKKNTLAYSIFYRLISQQRLSTFTNFALTGNRNELPQNKISHHPVRSLFYTRCLHE